MTTAEVANARGARWTDVAVIVAAAGAVAVAAWLLPASVHIVTWSAGGPSRVALLAPAGPLLWLMSGAVAVGGGVAFLLRAHLARVAAVAGPLCLLWLWGVPFLPWLPDRLPLLLVLAGPLRWIVLAAAVLGAIAGSGGLGGWPHVGGRLPGRRTALIASFAIYLGLGLLSARQVGPGGDEPHYLVIAHSLLADGDLQIENNHQRGDYRAFFGGTLRPDYMTRGANGAIYSIHAPGLPVLLLPGYAAAGYRGALLIMCLIAALAALAVFELAEALTSRGTAWLTWAAVCLTVPFVPHAWLLFPETPGALLVAWAALWVWRPAPASAAAWLWRGAALGALPWLHTKFIVFSAIFAVALGIRLRRQPRALAALALALGATIGLWLAYFYAIYGVFDPEAPYGDYTSQFVLLRNIPRGLLGLLIDQKFGLLFYSPVYLLAIAGMWIAGGRRPLRWASAVLVVTAAAFIASSARLHMWWGGSSAPARFLVPVLPCLAPMLALALHEARGLVARTLVLLWLPLSLGVALAGAARPARLLLFSEPHGRARLLEAVQAGSPLAMTVPTFTVEDWLGPLAQIGPWGIAATLALAAIAVAARRSGGRGVFGVSVAGCLAFLAVASLATARPAAAAREETVRRGALDLLSRYDANRLVALEYPGIRRVAPARLLELGTVVDSRVPAGPYVLAPGAYDARVWFRGSRPRHGVIAVTSRQVVFGERSGDLPNPAVVPFELPVAVSRVVVSVRDESAAQAVARIELVPRAIVPASERERRPIRAIESINGWPGAYVLYTSTPGYPEGGVFWTRHTEATTILVAPGGAARIILTLHLGPQSGDVRVSAGGHDRLVPVPPGRTVEVMVDVPPGHRLVPITVQSPVSFVPAAVDAASTDTRRLGCQVRIGLEAGP
jgi:hypothetical protein